MVLKAALSPLSLPVTPEGCGRVDVQPSRQPMSSSECGLSFACHFHVLAACHFWEMHALHDDAAVFVHVRDDVGAPNVVYIVDGVVMRNEVVVPISSVV